MPETMSQITASALVVYVIEWAKGSKLVPFLNADSKGLARLFAAMGAALSTAGITGMFDAQAGRLVVEGLTYPAMMAAAWQFAGQFVIQQIIYDSVGRKIPALTVEAFPDPFPQTPPKAGN